MADTVLDALRSKYPQYADVPDDKLTLAVGKKYPQYLEKDPQFKARFNQLAMPDEGSMSASYQNTLPKVFRRSDIGHAIFGPTEDEQRLIQSGVLAGPPKGDVGIVPLATSLPIVPDVPEMALASKLPKVASAIGVATKTLYTYWAAKFAAAQPERLKQLKEQFEAGDWRGAAKGMAEDLVEAGMTVAMVHGLAKPLIRQAKLNQLTKQRYASKNPKTAALYGNVRSQPAPAQGMPAAKGSGGVQSQTQAVAQKAQVPLTPEQHDAAKNFWDGASDNAKNKFVGASEGYGNKGWHELTEQQQRTVAQKTGVLKPKEEPPPTSLELANGRALWESFSKASKDNHIKDRQGDKWSDLTEDQQAAFVRMTQIRSEPIQHGAATTEDIIDPEHQAIIDAERGNVDVPVENLTEKEIADLETSKDPFAQKKGQGFRQNIATIDRDKGRIVINPKEFNQWIKSIPASQRQSAVRSLIGEERIHLATDDAGAKAYWSSLTGLEQAIVKRRYGDVPGMDDTLWGHEALRFRMQQMARMTPREIAEAAGREKWTLKALTVMETAVRGIRETLGTKASSEARAILDKVQKNINLGKVVAGGGSPGAVNKEVQDRGENEAKALEEQAQMYLESGDVESANELKDMAKKLRGQTGEQYFPGAAPHWSDSDRATMKAQLRFLSEEQLRNGRTNAERKYAAALASKNFHAASQFATEGQFYREELENRANKAMPGARPKKRAESVFQDKFILPGMETAKVAGSTRAGSPTGEDITVPPDERASAEGSGALPRLTGAELDKRGFEWVQKGMSNALAASQEGKNPQKTDFKDFVDYMKRQEPKLQTGQLFDMWQRSVSGFLDNATGEQLQTIAKTEFGRSATMSGIKRAEKAGKEQGEMAGMEAQSKKEGGRSIWDRRVADKRTGAHEGEGDVISAYGQREVQIHQLQQQLDEVQSPRLVQRKKNDPLFAEIYNSQTEAAHQFDRLNDEFRIVDGQLKNAKEFATRQGLPKEALEHWQGEVERLGRERNELQEQLHISRRAKDWLKKLPELKYEKQDSSPEAESLKGQIQMLKADNRKIEDDYKQAIGAQRWRSRVISAVFRRMVKPAMLESEPVTHRTSVDPSEIRQGSQYAYEDISGLTRPKMEEVLRSEARRSNEDAPNITRRAMVIQNPRTGAVHIVDVYSRGQLPGQPGHYDIRVQDPASPKGDHVELDSILNRYRPLYSVLLDQPVRSLRQDFKSLAHYQKEFGLQATRDKSEALNYSPTEMSEEQFIGEIGGRIPQSEGGHLQGVFRAQSWESGEGAHELGERTPLTDAEASSLMDRIADSKNASDVEAALREIDPTKDRQAFSALAKLGRHMAEEFPFATPDELVDTLSQRIYDAHSASKSADELFQKLGATMEKPEPEPPPSKTSRELVHMRSRAPTATSKKLPPQYFPGARRKAPAEEKSIAGIVWDSLGRLMNARDADINDAFPELEHIRDMIDAMPPTSPKKVSQKLEEEAVRGNSDIKLTPNEQKFYDVMAKLHADNQDIWDAVKQINPDTPKEYWPRMLQDANSVFERMVRGAKTYVTEGSVLSRTAWFTKPRTIRAIEDEQGNRHVVAIVGKGQQGKLVKYEGGQAEDMGPYYFKDVIRREERMNAELKPVNEEADQLIHDNRMLSRTEERKAASKRLIAANNRRLAELAEEAENIMAKYPEHTLDNRTWLDKNKKEWRMTEATTAEIESNMRSRFYGNAYPLLLSQNLKLRQMLRNAQWMEAFKKSPEFQQVASVGDQPGRPTDWRLTQLPQMRGIYFHPRLADVLDQFHEQSTRGDTNAWRNINRALQGALFWNQPFLHDPNLLGWWFATRGASKWLNPSAYPRMYRTFKQAFTDVLSKNGDYTNYLRLGTPLQLKRMHEFGDRVTRMLSDELESNPPLAKRIANILGYANPIHLMNTVGRVATEGLHDVLTLQLIHELEERGMSPHEALRKVTAVMPDRRIPPRVMGSRWLSKMMANGDVLWFAAYHYSEGRAFSNMIKGAAGKNENMSRSDALDKIGAIALLMFAAYPLLDDLIKHVTGKDYAFRRAGPTTWPSAIADVATGKKTPAMVTPSFLSLSPLFTAIPSLAFNRNLMNRGLPIYNPRDPATKQAGDVAKFAANMVNPVQMYGDLINGRTTWEDVGLNLVGVRRDYSTESYNQIYGWAYNWARETGNQKLLSKFQREANEVYPPSEYNRLKSALEDGSDGKVSKEVKRLTDAGHTPAQIERELRPSSHPLSGMEDFEEQFRESLTPEQRQVYEKEVARRESIYQRYLEMAGQ